MNIEKVYIFAHFKKKKFQKLDFFKKYFPKKKSNFSDFSSLCKNTLRLLAWYLNSFHSGLNYIGRTLSYVNVTHIELCWWKNTFPTKKKLRYILNFASVYLLFHKTIYCFCNKNPKKAVIVIKLTVLSTFLLRCESTKNKRSKPASRRLPHCFLIPSTLT